MTVSENKRGTESAAAVLSGSNATTGAAPRFQYIDGLRGVASVIVAIGHLAGAAEDRHPGILGHGVRAVTDLGRYGVQIFFVLSGFVIAHSVVTGAYSFRYMARFAGRRFVRLDLPYWSVIALECFLLWLSGIVMARYARSLPPPAQILSNAFYLQSFLGYPDILPTFWTLCYEVQFYLVFVLSLVLLTKLVDAGVAPGTTRMVTGVALALSFLWSLSIYLGLVSLPLRGLFLDRWFQFALGVITYLFYRGSSGPWPVGLAVGLCVLGGAVFGVDAYRVTSTSLTAATSIAILASLRSRWWNSLLIGPIAQFFGRISYSLYLLHLAVGWRATVLTRELLRGHYNLGTAHLALFIGLGVSVLASWIMYRLVERPAINLARTIKLPQRPTAPVRTASVC